MDENNRPSDALAATMSLQELLNIRFFDSPIPYLTKPSRPRMPSNSPSREEMKEYEGKLDAYGEEYAAWEKNQKARQEDGARLIALFYTRLAEDLGYDPDDAFAQKLVAKAYEDGHAYGMSEVYTQMSNLIELWDAYLEVRNERDALRKQVG